MLAVGAGTVASQTAASLGGYITVWAVCAAGGFLAAVLLLFVPKVAFGDEALDAAAAPDPEGTAGQAQIL